MIMTGLLKILECFNEGLIAKERCCELMVLCGKVSNRYALLCFRKSANSTLKAQFRQNLEELSNIVRLLPFSACDTGCWHSCVFSAVVYSTPCT